MKFKLIASLLAITLIFCACAAEIMPEEEMPVDNSGGLDLTATVYYQTQSGLLVPTSTVVRWSDNTLQTVANLLPGSPEVLQTVAPEGLTGVLPERSSISVTVSGNVAKADITGNFDNISDGAAKNIIVCVINTCSAFPGVREVDLTVNGTKKIGRLTIPPTSGPMKINEFGKNGDKKVAVTVFYADKETGILVPTTKYLSNDKPRTVVAEMSKTPSPKILESVSYRDFTFVDAKLAPETGELNVTFKNRSKTTDEAVIAKLKEAVTQTCTQLPGVKSVNITIK